MTSVVARVGRLAGIGVLLTLLALSGCERIADPSRGTIPRERFIQANVELRQIDPEAPEADSLRAVVLQEHGVTEAQMRAFVEARANRPRELAEIWAEIQTRLEEAAAPPDTIPEFEEGDEDELEPLLPEEDEDEDSQISPEPREIPRGRLRVSTT